MLNGYAPEYVGEAVVGLCTGNPVMICDGVTGAVKSYAMSTIMSPITEPIKDAVGDVLGDTDWAEVAETCPMW